MKKIIALLILSISTPIFSQIIIGDNIGTATDKTSVLLEFANQGNKGIILPYLRTLPSSPTEGTIILDATTPTSASVKYYNGSWQDLSGQNADISQILLSQPTVAQVTESTTSKAIIGKNSSSADGVLVLESDTKAMVLPIVASTDDVPSPSPGMMVFINKTGAKRVAVFNGSKWSFWKP